MSKNKLLLITPFFAPQTHAAVFRAFKLAIGLPDHDWEVHVLTVDINYNYNEDASLLEKIPEGVFVHEARYIEPTVRGVKMALGGADRTFMKVHAPSTEKAKPVDDAVPPAEPSLLRKMYKSLLSNYLKFPWLVNSVTAG
jgi:hypothetical protein